MATEAGRRLGRLAQDIGRARLRGIIECDQIYARYQHETLNLRHPHGGGPKFLWRPLADNHEQWLQHIADKVLTPDGTAIFEGMSDVLEMWSKDAAKAAPIEWGDLRNSMHPTVRQGSRVHYDRAPMARRLTDEELRLKARWRL
jgi:hypothetical protein